MIIWLAFMAVSMLFLMIASVVFWLWALIDCIRSPLSSGEKAVWIIAILFLNLVGVTLYVLLGRRMHQAGHGKRLVRSKDRVIAGVAGGLAEYLGVDPTLVRIIWVLLVLFGFGTGIIIYIIAWILMPEK